MRQGKGKCLLIQSNISDGSGQSAGREMVDLSVIIVSWNVAKLLRDCLQALASPEVSGDLCLEVVVIDNASSDDSARVAASFDGVKVLRSKQNLGYGRANNLGFRRARGKYLLVLNPDTVLRPGSLKTLLAFAERHPQAGMVAPRLLNPDGTVQISAFHYPTLPMALLDLFPLPPVIPGRVRAWLQQSSFNGRYANEAHAQHPFRIDHPLGAAMLLRREAVGQVGGFDECIFMYSEEVDLAIRLSESGWECWQVPAASVVHLGGQSTGQMPDRMFVELWRSRLYLYRKHRGPLSNSALRTLLAASQLLELARTLVRSLWDRQTENELRARRKRAFTVLKLALGYRL